MQDVVLTIEGVAPLIMSSDRGVNPLDPLARELKRYTSMRKKPDEVHETIARIEFELRMYWDAELGPFIPCGNVHKALVEGARQSKDGRKIEQGVIQLDTRVPLLYEGPRDIDGMYETGANGHVYTVPVGIGQKRTLRTRPIFWNWAINAPFAVDEAKLDLDEFAAITETTGAFVGLGDRRPAFGRFRAVVTEGGGTNGKTAVSAGRLATAVA